MNRDKIIELLLATTATVVGCFTFQALWKWYVAVPFSYPQLRMVHIMGLAMLVSLVTHKFKKSENIEAEVIAEVIVFQFIVLIVGWALHFWM